MAGWWLDGGEGPPARARLHAGDGTLLHNIYDRFRQQAFAEGEAADRPHQRVFMLCRSGAAGMQRLGAACWSGDINNDFATLEAQIPLGLNTGLSGVPYWGTDVGGFWEATRGDNPHIKYHSNRRGYIACTATPAQMRADFKILEKVSVPDQPVRIGGSLVVQAGRAGSNTD